MLSSTGFTMDASVLKVAKELKQQLEQRLMGKTSPTWDSGCDDRRGRLSQVIGIDMPTPYPYQIGLSVLWTCSMKDEDGTVWSQGLSAFIHRKELYPMFRKAFAGMAVKAGHPAALLYHDKPNCTGDHASIAGRKFTGAGRLVTVTPEKSVYVRPTGELSQSAWLNAELLSAFNRITGEPVIWCKVDPLEFGMEKDLRAGRYSLMDAIELLPTFYVRLAGEGNDKDLYLPVARLVEANASTAVAAFELDNLVESFEVG